MWYNTIVADITELPKALTFYNKELEEAADEVKLKGNAEKAAAALPGLISFRFNQYQEVEAILEFLNIALRKERAKVLRKFMEGYNREMSLREAEKWVDGEESVVDFSQLVNEVALVRNKYQGIIKGLEVKQWMITNIVKLRAAGLEDAEIGRF